LIQGVEYAVSSGWIVMYIPRGASIPSCVDPLF
jgi:hypothetical protein